MISGTCIWQERPITLNKSEYALTLKSWTVDQQGQICRGFVFCGWFGRLLLPTNWCRGFQTTDFYSYQTQLNLDWLFRTDIWSRRDPGVVDDMPRLSRFTINGKILQFETACKCFILTQNVTYSERINIHKMNIMILILPCANLKKTYL